MKKNNLEKIIRLEDVDERIIHLRQQDVILNIDIATLYGVQTRDINKAVKNNPDKFPDGYIFELTKKEFEDLQWKFSTAKFSKTRVLPKAFTEKGLYMLATILKSKQATQTTLAIIEAYAKLKNLSRNINSISRVQDENKKQDILGKSGELITEIFSNDFNSQRKRNFNRIEFCSFKLQTHH
jgi:ORF6N domain-containing protein